MSQPEFAHIRMNMVKDVAVVEISTNEMHSPAASQELGAELARVSAQKWATRLLLNFRHVTFFNSTGFGILFSLVKQARADGRVIKFCEMQPAVKLGAEISGLPKVAEVFDLESDALASFQAA